MVHPGFEYWGSQDPSRGQNRKVSRDEVSNRVARMMQGAIRDRGCPKAHCLKRPTRVVSFLCLFVLLCFSIPSCSVFALESFLPCFPYAAHLLGCNKLRISSVQAKVQEFGSPAPLPEGDAGKDAAAPANLKELEAADLE